MKSEPLTNYFGENKPREDFGRRSLRGGLISIGARIANAFVQMASVVVLARLLSPEDYGLVSMVGAIIGVAPLLIDLGTRDAVVQHRCITPEEISALFWITVALGCAFAVAGAACGPLIAHFYREPHLATVALVSSLSFVALSLSYQHQALLRRAMKYQELAIIDIGASIISTTIAIAMAFKGWAYWALVLRPVTGSVVTALGAWCNCRWLPGRPKFTAGVLRLKDPGTGRYTAWRSRAKEDFFGTLEQYNGTAGIYSYPGV